MDTYGLRSDTLEGYPWICVGYPSIDSHAYLGEIIENSRKKHVGGTFFGFYGLSSFERCKGFLIPPESPWRQVI